MTNLVYFNSCQLFTLFNIISSHFKSFEMTSHHVSVTKKNHIVYKIVGFFLEKNITIRNLVQLKTQQTASSWYWLLYNI
jgi:glycine cleavage system regulatory protein